MITSVIDAGNEAAHGEPPVRITPVAERRTSRFLSKYEVAKVVGERAKQIAAGVRFTTQKHKNRKSRDWGLGASGYGGGELGPGGVPMTPDSMFAHMACGPEEPPPLTEVKAALAASDPVVIAQHELVHKRIPYIIRRTFPSGDVEDIPLKDLAVDAALLSI